MTTGRVPAGFLALLIAGTASVVGAAPQGGTTACDAAQPVNVLSVVGPMVGSHPAWLVDGSSRWTGSASPIKTLWVLAQPTAGIEISGRRRGGSEVATFQRGSEPPTDRLTVADPKRDSVKPGGASADVLQAHAFIPSLVFYPVPGCWEFTVVSVGVRSRIVRNLEARP
ncbi:MAG: hypothetical protein R2745_17225 [Vicinamibacterales bacterium]